MAFNNWPYTNFQDLNLGWIILTYKDAVTKALEALAKATTVEAEVGTYTSRINALETSDAEQDANIYEANETALSALSTANTAIQMANLIADNQAFICVVNNSVSPVTSSKNYAALQSILVTQKKPINFIYVDPYGYEYETALVTTSSNKIRAIFILDRASSSDFYRVIYVDILSDDTINISTDTIDTSGGGGTVQNGIFLITAVFSNGEYTFDRNQADILSAIVGGKLPVVRYHSSSGNNNEYDMWKMGYYYTDGEDLYIYFDRLNGNGNASQMRWFASTGKAVEVIRPTLPQATSADEGQVPMVNSFGNYQLVTPSSAQGTPKVTMASTDTTAALDANKFYVFPEMASLSVTLNTPASNTIVNEFHFRFTSGATATQFDLPATVEIPDDFDVAANTVYEISIIDNYMVYSSWAVTA